MPHTTYSKWAILFSWTSLFLASVSRTTLLYSCCSSVSSFPSTKLINVGMSPCWSFYFDVKLSLLVVLPLIHSFRTIWCTFHMSAIFYIHLWINNKMPEHRELRQYQAVVTIYFWPSKFLEPASTCSLSSNSSTFWLRCFRSISNFTHLKRNRSC